MRLIRSPLAMSRWSRELRREGVTIGLVPTMGALHAGHRALIRHARLTCDAVVVSIFVNPMQFGPREDFARYPRPLRRDVALCRDEGVDVVFAPRAQDVYPAGFQTVVEVRNVSRPWEGEARPAHFAGVSTVVLKLLNVVQPAVLFMGQKDYQQAVVVTRLIQDLNVPVRMIVHPTVREADGLALSSRNVYLTARQREVAPVLFRALRAGETAIRAGVGNAAPVRRVMQKIIASEPSVTVDYLAVCDAESLEPITQVEGPVVLLGAVRVGSVRLIDNVRVGRLTGSRRRGR